MLTRVKAILVFLLMLAQYGALSQNVDSLNNRSLLIDPHVEIQSTEGINAMYNFDFIEANRQFKYLKWQYPWHPLPYLLTGLSYWWRMVPEPNDEQWDDIFIAYMDTSRLLSERLLASENELEGAFFLAASHAFEGRLYSERGNYGKAALSGRNALKYFKQCKGNETYSPELLFGDALFNYYGEWIREEYPLLRPLMVLFPKGDKKLGIEQLEKVARNAFYSRTEAQYYLMRILNNEEGDTRGALVVAENLNKYYPNNAYFHRYYTRLLYQMGDHLNAESNALSILTRIDSAWTGYGATSGRYAAFFLGHIYNQRALYNMSRAYYLKALEFSESVGATESGYYFYSLLHLGDIALKQKDKELARVYYKRVKKASKKKHPTNKRAREKLKSL